ncbi:NADPH:quinone reductase [Nostoc sp. XA010]|uniref:NADPH:quinone reductase n=1 Tax=Nostoc sp. XA010 TaxID=2780407 RepID=UPI001E628C98|nr:NADPH:quinone reductase [Nostoc sp. XA010]MCC5661744.1 NADPH:quinone reductase [Nostoc sp. XA010]
MKTIRVHVFGGPEVMQLEELPDIKPGSGQVVVRVKSIGVNPLDAYLRSGLNPQLVLPYTPGMDAAGVVESIGSDVTQVAVGDRVFTTGTISGAYADMVLCEVSQVHSLPQHLTYAQGSAINVPYAGAYRALFHRGQAKPGEVLLIHGASGGVGIAAVQLARSAGMMVIGTGGTDARRRLVVEQGAHYVFDHHDPSHLEQIMTLTKGCGVDVILELLANVNLSKDLGILALRGRVVVMGSRGTVKINPLDAMYRDASILGTSLRLADEREKASIYPALLAGLENQTLCPVVGYQMPLADASLAHIAVMEPSSKGKIVLIP